MLYCLRDVEYFALLSRHYLAFCCVYRGYILFCFCLLLFSDVESRICWLLCRAYHDFICLAYACTILTTYILCFALLSLELVTFPCVIVTVCAACFSSCGLGLIRLLILFTFCPGSRVLSFASLCFRRFSVVDFLFMSLACFHVILLS